MWVWCVIVKPPLEVSLLSYQTTLESGNVSSVRLKNVLNWSRSYISLQEFLNLVVLHWAGRMFFGHSKLLTHSYFDITVNWVCVWQNKLILHCVSKKLYHQTTDYNFNNCPITIKNHISMAYSLGNICTKNYWNRSTIVKIIIGGWVVPWYTFCETQCMYRLLGWPSRSVSTPIRCNSLGYFRCFRDFKQ